MKDKIGFQVNSQTNEMGTIILLSTGLQSCINGPPYGYSPTEHRTTYSSLVLPLHPQTTAFGMGDWESNYYCLNCLTYPEK